MEPATKEATGEQPSPEVKPTGEQPSAHDPQASPLEGLSDAELLAALEESATDESTPPEPSDYEERQPPPEPKTTATETPTGREQEVEDEPGEGPSEKKEEPAPTAGAIKRLSVKGLNPEEQKQLAEAVSMVREGKAGNIPEAMQALGMIQAPAPAAAEAPDGDAPGSEDSPEASGAEPPQSPPVSGSVESIRAEIASLREQRRQAVEDYDAAEQARLTDEIEDKMLALSDAREAESEAKQQATRYESEYDAALDRVEAKYPEAADESSSFYRVLDDRVAVMQARGDSRVTDPRFIESVAEEVAADLGRKAHVEPAPNQPAKRPAGSALVPGSSSAPRMSEEELRAAIHNLPIEELEEALFTE